MGLLVEGVMGVKKDVVIGLVVKRRLLMVAIRVIRSSN